MTGCKKVTEVGYEKEAVGERKRDMVISCDTT